MYFIQVLLKKMLLTIFITKIFQYLLIRIMKKSKKNRLIFLKQKQSSNHSFHSNNLLTIYSMSLTHTNYSQVLHCLKQVRVRPKIISLITM